MPEIGILILGAGGHGKVVADILLSAGTLVAGYLDDDPALWGTTCLNLPVLGAISTCAERQPQGIILGIGSNRARRAVAEKMAHLPPEYWVNAVHPRALLAQSVRLGHGTVICAGAVINPDAVVGNHAIINTSATVDHDCVISDYVHIAPGSHLAGGIQVGEGAFVGIGASVIPYRSIGAWSTVGAGAAVISDIPGGVTAKGVPARWS